MKVLMLDPDPVGYYGTDLCNSLQARDVEIRLLTARGFMHRGRVECSCAEVAPHSGAGRWPRKLFEESSYLVRLLQEAFAWRPDVVHVQWLRLPVEIVAIALLRVLGFRIVWTAHNVEPHEKRRLATVVQSLLYRVANQVVVHTGSTRDRVALEFGLAPDRIHVIPHGLHLEQNARPQTREGARARLGLPISGTLFLFFGQFRPYKGYEDLLDAFGEAAGATDEIHLVLAGRATPDRARDVRRRLELLPNDAAARVHSFLAVDEFVPVSTMDLLFCACDCVVLPYREISQSGVLYQAFGYSRPVFASRVGGFAETVRNGENGALFEAGDVKALATLLTRWAARRTSLSEMGERGRALAIQANSWDRVALATRDVYRSMLEKSEAA